MGKNFKEQYLESALEFLESQFLEFVHVPSRLLLLRNSVFGLEEISREESRQLECLESLSRQFVSLRNSSNVSHSMLHFSTGWFAEPSAMNSWYLDNELASSVSSAKRLLRSLSLETGLDSKTGASKNLEKRFPWPLMKFLGSEQFLQVQSWRIWNLLVPLDLLPLCLLFLFSCAAFKRKQPKCRLDWTSRFHSPKMYSGIIPPAKLIPAASVIAERGSDFFPRLAYYSLFVEETERRLRLYNYAMNQTYMCTTMYIR